MIDDLSREPQHEEYRLHLMVEDSGVPKQTAETLVRIQIPINTPPTLPDKFLFDVREDVTINTSLGLIGAMDPDVLENRDYLEYALNNEAGNGTEFCLFRFFYTYQIIIYSGPRTKTL